MGPVYIVNVIGSVDGSIIYYSVNGTHLHCEMFHYHNGEDGSVFMVCHYAKTELCISLYL